MMYLFLSVFFTTVVFLFLKEFNRFGVDNLQGIVVSYFSALFFGIYFSGVEVSYSFLISRSWVLGAVIIAVVFIIVFNLMAITAQKGGLSVMTIANKMSVSIPILVGVFLYSENLGILKIVGILVALFAVWLVSKKTETQKLDKRFWYLPFFIFIGSGLADSLLNHMQTFYVPQQELAIFSTSLFLFCGLIGVLVCLVKYLLGNFRFSVKSAIAGLLLGVPNYFSIYFLLKALAQPDYQTSLIFSLNNLLVVLLSVLLGIIFYKEKLSQQNYIGVALSVFAIIILYFA